MALCLFSPYSHGCTAGSSFSISPQGQPKGSSGDSSENNQGPGKHEVLGSSRCHLIWREEAERRQWQCSIMQKVTAKGGVRSFQAQQQKAWPEISTRTASLGRHFQLPAHSPGLSGEGERQGLSQPSGRGFMALTLFGDALL